MKNRERPPIFFPTPISQKLVNLIERHAEELTNNWLRDVKQQILLPTYRRLDEKELYNRAYRVYSQLGKWISMEATKEELKSYWQALGKERRQEGFALSEVIFSLCLIRRHLWQKIQAEGLLDTALDLYQALELYNRVVAFFDRALYYAARGFEEID